MSIERDRERVFPTCVVGQDVILAPDVSLGPFAVLEDGAVVGAGTRIEALCFIGRSVTIGAGCLIESGAILREGVRLGNRVRVGSGAVIGADGFGFVEDGGVHHKIPQVGAVEIGDDVVIGAGACIDRATTGVTRVGARTRVGALAQVAHNVQIGEDCEIGSQAGCAGSSQVGRGVRMGPGSGLGPHLSIGDGAVVDALTGLTKSIPAGSHVAGFPPRTAEEFAHVQALMERAETVEGRLAVLEARRSSRQEGAA